MKNNLTVWGMIISLLTLSCHKPPALTRLSCCAKDGATAATTIPVPLETNASIYQMPGQWIDAHDRSLQLSQLKGKVQIVAMIFTHCAYACPRIVQDMKAIGDSLPPSLKKDVGFVLVSMDADRDGPAQLSRFTAQQGLGDDWILLHGNAGQVRELSMLLNVQYRKLDDGNFTHSNAIFILDRNGQIRQSLEGLDQHTAIALNTISRLVKY